MRSLSTRAAGFFIVILGIWGGLVPFVGPYFHFALGPDKSWTWTSGRLWLSVLPGVVAILGGLMLLGAGPRLSGKLGALLALAAGIWFAIGPPMSLLWNASGAQGAAHGSTGVRVLEMLTYHSALGAVMAALAGYALPGFVTRRAAAAEQAAVGAGAAAERDVATAPERSGVRNEELAGVGAGTRRERVAVDGEGGERDAPTAVADRPTTDGGAAAADGGPTDGPPTVADGHPATEDSATAEDSAVADGAAPDATAGAAATQGPNGGYERSTTVRRRSGGLLSAFTRRR